MPAKALGPLLSALPKAPRDLRLNQRLAALHTRAGRFSEAAVCCRSLEQLYHDAGHPDEASRYKDLADKYEERMATPVDAIGVESLSAFASTLEVSSPAASNGEYEEVAEASPTAGLSTSGLFFHKAPSAVPAPEEFEVRAEAPVASSEIDISEEWDGAEVSDEPAATVPQAADSETIHEQAESVKETIEELRFYLKHAMPEQARVVFAKLEKLKPGAEQLASVWKEIEAADTTPSAAHTPAVEEVEEEVSVEEPDEITAAAEPVAHHATHRDRPKGRPWHRQAAVDREFVADRHRVPAAPEEEFLPKIPIRTIFLLRNPPGQSTRKPPGSGAGGSARRICFRPRSFAG